MTEPTAEQLREQLALPPIEQIGFVVPDIKQAMVDYEALFGPWTTMDVEMEGAQYRGELHDASLSLAFGKSGDLEIELIEITGGNSPHREFIDSGRSGMHHIRYRTPDIDNKIALAKGLGYELIWYQRLSEDTAFGYLERAGDPLIVEFLQMS